MHACSEVDIEQWLQIYYPECLGWMQLDAEAIAFERSQGIPVPDHGVVLGPDSNGSVICMDWHRSRLRCACGIVEPSLDPEDQCGAFAGAMSRTTVDCAHIEGDDERACRCGHEMRCRALAPFVRDDGSDFLSIFLELDSDLRGTARVAGARNALDALFAPPTADEVLERGRAAIDGTVEP